MLAIRICLAGAKTFETINNFQRCVEIVQEYCFMKNFVVATLAMIAVAVLAGCTSSSSRTAGYTGPSVSSVTTKRADARQNVRNASRDLRKAKKELATLERRIARDERRVKRKRGSAKRKAEAAKRLKGSKRELRRAKRTVRRAQRAKERAERRERRAILAVKDAKRRQAEAKRRFELAKKNEKQALARREAERSKAEQTKSSPRTRLFGLSDPALKNINDYKARVDGGFPITGIPVEKMNKRLFRQEVRYLSREKPGTIVVDPGARFLYLVQSGGRAIRYGIGVGKAGFEWSGSAHIGWKQEWPKWTPPDEMIKRRPDLAQWSTENGGMPGGPTNPLGARALYLMKDGKDTLYRLHGTPQWSSIGTAASSGCIRLMNQDVIDLYQRVPNGTKVVVL